MAILAKGRRAAGPLLQKQKKVNTFLPLFSSPTQENIFVFYVDQVSKRSVCYISNAFAP